MEIFYMTFAYILPGFFFAGALYLLIAVCYSTLHYMREDQIKDNRSETSWNSEDKSLDTITEFRDDFSGR